MESKGRIVRLERRERFSACHRLHSRHLSDEENKTVYGKCNHANGHGHNYVLYVTVEGETDVRTGMVINLADLKVLIKKHVLDQLDHRNIDVDVPYFADGRPSTAENIAVYVWEQLQPHLGGLLFQVKIEETENNFAIYRGG
mmetsp:Transcript_15855/g.44903  ORF Transcript_15855/g.44903 Transcript_15855/m.44903 type:complete len:142 (+) Transcript_15855:171-596(+)